MRKWLIIGLLTIVAVYGGWRFGEPGYHRLMAERLLHAAQAKAEAHDSTEAIRLYVLALQKDKSNLGVLRSFAAFLTQVHDAGAISIWARISQLEPANDDAFLEYVECALTFGEPKLAHRVLLQRRAQPGSKINENARFSHILGTCYFVENNLALAEGAYSEAVQRDPKNRRYRINQAQLQLYASDPAIRDSALALLDAASGTATERRMVLPSLLQYAAQAALEPAQLGEWLQKADGSLAPTDDGFPALLAALKRWRPDRFAARLPGDLQATAARSDSALAAERWLLKEGLNQELLAFQDKLSGKDQTSFQSLRLVAEAMFRLQQKDRLSEVLDGPAWKAKPVERLAWKERLRRALPTAKAERSSADGDALEWQKILGKARNDPEGLFDLVELTYEWGWSEENEAALWATVEHDNVLSGDALNSLARIYLKRGDGTAVIRVLDRQSQIAPNDPAILNNLAYMSFLFRRGGTKAKRLSDELCQSFPHSTDIIATSAFGRLMKGDVAGGLKLFEKTSPETLVGTSAGMTYGLLLAAKGDRDGSRFLKNAERWSYFPEERQLIVDARKKIAP